MRIGRIGSFGEDKATIYLQSSHYQIYKEIFKENGMKLILLQKTKKTKEIVFVEVKTRQLNYANS